MPPRHRRIPSSQKVWLWVGLGALAVSLLLTADWIRMHGERLNEVNNLREEIIRTEREINDRKETLIELESQNETMEILARRELGLIKPGEVEFRFLPSTSPASPQ